MNIEEIRKVYITTEEKEILNKAATLIENINNNMDDEDELVFTDENGIVHSLTIYESKEIPWVLSNIAQSKIEIA